MASELRFDEVLRVLTQNEVEFIVVGGIAAILQGSPLTTDDIDVVYSSTEENLPRLARALAKLEAQYLDPAGRRLEPNTSRLASMKVHLLSTKCGRVDVLRTVGNNLAYQDLVGQSRVFQVEEFSVQVLNLETIIATKEHANRPKDRSHLLFLRQLLTEIKRRESE